MRMVALAAVLVAAACSATRPKAPADPNAFEVDAKGAPAVVDQTLTLEGVGEPIGFVSAIARCDDLLLFADLNGVVRRLRLSSRQTLPSIARDAANLAMAADCPARTVYLFGPSGSRSQRGQLQVQALDLDTGALRRTYPLEAMFLPDWNASVADGALVIGGTWMPMPTDGRYQHPPPAAFYSDKKLGLRLALDSGVAEGWLEPYDESCQAHCAFSTLSPIVDYAPLAWMATQASSKEIAFYGTDGAVRRRLEITSPLFADDGSVLKTLGGEPDVRWSSRNSLVKSADQVGGVVVTVHYRTRLPADYVFGQSTEFDYWMNLHGLDGRKLVSDVKLPGMPIGHDDTHLYVTDYGPDGRHSAPDKLKVLRIPVKAGTEGFKH